MSARGEGWGRFAARTAVTGAVVLAAAFVGNRLARADVGDPVRKALTVSGRLSGVSGTVTATFRFYRAMGDATALCAPVVSIRDGMEREAGSGAFSVEVPLDQAGHVCPDTLFHNPSAFVEVVIGETTVVARRPINPVPYAVYAQQYGTPECPVGYSSDTSPTGTMRRCILRREDGVTYDDVLRVGVGPSAFWIDRYEATIWSTPDARGEALNSNAELDLGSLGLPRTGEWSGATPRLYARSRGIDVLPARWVTWFQADALCRASGKRLPTGAEWIAAARGTADSGCNISSTAPRTQGGGMDVGCYGEWGTHNMIGNLWEWTADWFASAGQLTSAPSVDRNSVSGRRINDAISPWPTETGRGYAGDGTWNVAAVAARSPEDDPNNTVGMPAAAVRGGAWDHGASAGVFSFALTEGPSSRLDRIGFRCVIPR